MKIKDVYEYFSETEEISESEVFEQDEEHRILLDNIYIHVPELNLDIHTGYYEMFEEESGEYEVNFDFYMFFDSTTKAHRYEEQGSGLEACIYNYCKMIERPVGNDEMIEEIECEIRVKEL